MSKVEPITISQFTRIFIKAVQEIKRDGLVDCTPQPLSIIMEELRRTGLSQAPAIVKYGPDKEKRTFILGNMVWVSEENCNSLSKMKDWLMFKIPAMIRSELPKLCEQTLTDDIVADGITMPSAEADLYSTLCCFSLTHKNENRCDIKANGTKEKYKEILYTMPTLGFCGEIFSDGNPSGSQNKLIMSETGKEEYVLSNILIAQTLKNIANEDFMQNFFDDETEKHEFLQYILHSNNEEGIRVPVSFENATTEEKAVEVFIEQWRKQLEEKLEKSA